MRGTPIDTPHPAPVAAPTPGTDFGAVRPETVMVCRLISGDLLVYGVPDGPPILLTSDAADPLRATLDTLLAARPGGSA